MPIWITALGIGGIGCVYGYVLLYILKRYLPPIALQTPTIRELVFLLVSLGIGLTPASISSVDNVNQIGPYGLGLVLGFFTNVAITITLELNGKNR